MADTLKTKEGLYQHTLKSSIHCSGVGLHSGRQVTMRLHPAPANSGIVFKRVDLPNAPVVPALWDKVVDTRLCTVVSDKNGVSIGTVEHLMAALYGCGIDNVIVELNGPEVPIMDGSSSPFVFLIECAGVIEQVAHRKLIHVLKEVSIEDDGRVATLTPSMTPGFSCEIDFDTSLIGHQVASIPLDTDLFKSELANARTFGFFHEVSALQEAGLAKGGSLDNAVVIKDDKVMNDDGLRHQDEFVRHKILDSIGDLYLAGHPVIAHFHGVRCGHEINNMLLHELFADETAYRIVEAPDLGASASALAVLCPSEESRIACAPVDV